MPGTEPLIERLSALLAEAGRQLPLTGLGVVRLEGRGHVAVMYASAFGVAVHRASVSTLSAAVEPAISGLRGLAAVDLDADPGGFLETRLRLTGMSEDVRQRFGARQAFILPIPHVEPTSVLLAGFRSGDPLNAEQVALLESLAVSVGAIVHPPEAMEEELERLRRLESIDARLPGLLRVLDIREVFDRLSALTQDVLPHDMLVLGIFSDDLAHIALYAQTSAERFPSTVPTPYPRPLMEPWLYNYVADVTTHPLERDADTTRAGARASLRVAIRQDDRLLGLLNFMSREPAAYSTADVAIARRIADFVAITLSHQRLADEGRRAAELRERAANLEMLDGLLDTLAGVLDVREVFGRVSDIAQKVLGHDAMSVSVVTEDAERVRIYASRGLGDVPSPVEYPLPDKTLLTRSWDHELIEDLAASGFISARAGHNAGMESVLIIPVRFHGRLHGSVNFFSRRKGRFSRDDVVVGRRVADHIAMTLSHQRLAEEARVNEELRARAANLELIDELLAAVTTAGELPAVFDRVSNIAQKVLAHDALVLTAILPDGVRARVYASKAPESAAFPDVVAVPPLMQKNPQWDHDLIDDLQTRPDQKNLDATKLGYRGALRVAIRLGGEYAAGLSFLSMTPSMYSLADVPAARRIADTLTLSFSRERARALSKRADEATERAAKLEARVQALTEELDARTGYRRVIGQSLPWRQVLTQATQVAVTETTVLLLGESGTGKEVVARFVHRASARKAGPYVALNCAALPEHLLEAELFGYERGAFTGAMQSKPGQLEQASGGTLFLDEVGEMSLSAQAKFLRVLQEREFQRLGGTRVMRTDARIVAATNRDLHKAMGHGQFREDLFYRLHVFAIHLPGLRERSDDILPLSEAFITEFGRTLGRPPAGLSRDAKQALMEYHWPGNVRELRNVLERAAIVCDGGLIATEHLALRPQGVPAPRVETVPPTAAPPVASPAAPPVDLKSMERALIEKALQDARFNKSVAAKTLGLTRAQLYVRLRKYGLE